MTVFPANIDLSTLDGTTGFKISGAAAYDRSGRSVASAGDVNGDGFADLIVGAWGAGPHGGTSGASYVVFGKAGGFAANIDLSTLDGSTGFSLSGVAAGDQSGISVASAGDVNGDGFADMIVGATNADPHGGASGASYVVFGKAGGFAANLDLSSLDGSTGFKLSGAAAYDQSGSSVASAGDVNGDGFADLIVGALYADPHGYSSGTSYVVFGKAGGFAANLDLSSLDGSTGFKLSGAAARDFSGISVASAGDVNGDGFADLIVGAFGADPNGSYSGASYVVFGKANGFAVNINLSTLDGSTGFKLSGAAASDFSGWSVASAGDVNADGFADLIVGASGANSHGSGSGASYVVFGKASGFAPNIDLSTLNGSNGFRLNGAANNRSGYSVASAGDVNGDGFSDLIVGAWGADPHGSYSGASYVVFGKAGGFAANLDLSSLDGSTGFEISGAAANDRSGISVSSAGDVNGDGFADVIVGAWAADPHGILSGASYVVFGEAPDVAVNRTGTGASQTLAGGAFDDTLSGLGGNDKLYGHGGNDTLDGGEGTDTAVFSGALADYRIVLNTGPAGIGYSVVDLRGGSPDGTDTLTGIEKLQFSDQTMASSSTIDLSALDGTTGFKISGAENGRSVASAGDVNGDGFADLIVGAFASGASYVVFGKAGGFAANIDLSSLDGSTGFRLSGAAYDWSGHSVASAGDVNGDGFADLIVGAQFADSPGDASGASYVVFGKAGGFAANIDLLSLDGTTGFKLSGVAAFDDSGSSVASAGDVNGDGFDDLIVGAYGADPYGFSSGTSYVVFGKAGGFAANIDLSSLDGTTGFKLSGVASFGYSGFSVASAGDVNGDGFADLIVGAWGARPAGVSYVVFGKAGGFAANIALSSFDGSNGFTLSGGAAGDVSGFSVASAGDVNGDGFADVIVGAPRADPHDSASGASYVVFGKAGGFAANIDLSALDGSTGFSLSGAAANDQSGYSVSSAGDINGDGFADVIVGAYGADPNSFSSGTSYVVFGKAGGFPANIDLSSMDGTTGFEIRAPFGYSGWSVASAGDVNGDGFSDLIVGGSDGASYVVFGEAPIFAVNRTGTGASQTLAGGAFDDTLSGLGGNDKLYGNGGTDTAVFTGARTDYTITHNADGSYAVADQRGGTPDGTDTLHGIEFFQFSDQTIAAPVPALNGAGSTIAYTEGAAAATLEPALVASDVGNATLAGATVTIQGQLAGDELTINGTTSGTVGAITYSFSGGTLTLNGTDTVAHYQAALELVKFDSTSDDPTAGGSNAQRTIAWTVDDGAASNNVSNSVQTTIAITPVNDAPTLGGAGNAVPYTEQGAAVAVDDALTVNDPDSTNLTGATVTISANFQSGDTLHFTNQLGISFVSYGGGVLTLSGTTTLANYQTALYTVTFDNTTNDNPTNFGAATIRTITWVGNDGAGANNLSTGVTTTINVTGVDDPAVAQNDAFAALETTAIGAGLNLFNNNGSGADSDVDNAALIVASVTGGAGANVGSPFTLTSGALLTVHADGTFSYDPDHAFDSLHLAAPGTGAANTTAPDSFAYTLTNGNTATVSLTVNGVNNANTIYEGAGGDDTITGDATLGGLYHLEQGGNDTVTGGSGNDGFYFGAAFTANDHVNGGAGSNDQIGLEGDYSGGLTMGATTISGVEVIACLPGFSYNLTTVDANVATGDTLTIWAVRLASSNTLIFNGSAELDGGKFTVFGGAGNDSITGGSGADTFYGLGGADTLTGNGGADRFVYTAPGESTGNAAGTAYDTIVGFDAAVDQFDLPGTVTGLDATVGTGALSSASFDSGLAAAVGAGQLAAGHAVLFTPDSGTLNAHTFLVVDANGVAGYQSGADFVVDVTGGGFGALTISNFV